TAKTSTRKSGDRKTRTASSATRRRTPPKRAPLPKAKRELVISVDAGEKRVAVLEDDKVAEVYLERPERRSIAGNIYLGVVDNVPHGEGLGVSRRLEDEERNRLKAILKEHAPKKGGVIVRTAAEGASADDIERDLDFLQRLWKSIEAKSNEAKAPSLIYEE